MCQTKSGIIFKDRVYLPLDEDSHSQMLIDLGIKDDKPFPEFVKFEITPKDGNVFNHDIANWEFAVDQDSTPDWYDEKKSEAEVKIELKNWFESRFIFKGDIVEDINDGKWYMSGGTLNHMRGGTLNNMSGGTLNNMSGGTLNDMSGGTLNYMWGGTLNYMSGGTLNNMRGGTLNNHYDGLIITPEKHILVPYGKKSEYTLMTSPRPKKK